MTDKNIQISLPRSALEGMVLEYCQKYPRVPGARDMSEYLKAQLTSDKAEQQKGKVPGLDPVVSRAAEVYESVLEDSNFGNAYYIRLIHPLSKLVYDVYFQSADEWDRVGRFCYLYFVDGYYKYDAIIEAFAKWAITEIGISMNTSPEGYESERDYLSTVELISRHTYERYTIEDFSDIYPKVAPIIERERLNRHYRHMDVEPAPRSSRSRRSPSPRRSIEEAEEAPAPVPPRARGRRGMRSRFTEME